MDSTSRTALLIRCTKQDLEGIHEQAQEEYRSVGGCLLHMLERSLWIEESFGRGLGPVYLAKRAMAKTVRPKGQRAAILLRCSEEVAERIRQAARRRKMSISGFVLFSLHRHWAALHQVRNRALSSEGWLGAALQRGPAERAERNGRRFEMTPRGDRPVD